MCVLQVVEQRLDIDDIVCVCGSGGMAAGLAIANYLNSSPYRSVCHWTDIGKTPIHVIFGKVSG